MADDMTWVRNEEYNRIKAEERVAARRKREADREVRAAKDRFRRAEKEAEQLASRDEQLMRERIQAETDRLLIGIDEVSDEMRENLRRHVEETQRQIDGMRSSIRDVQNQADQLDSKIDSMSREISTNFQTIVEEQARKEERAQLYFNRFMDLLGQVNTLNPDKLAPVEVSEHEMSAAFIREDLAAGTPEAALGMAQSHIPALITLRTRLEHLNEQFRDLQAEGNQVIAELQENIRQLRDYERNQRTVEAGQSSYEYDGNIVFWTNDLFTVAVQNYENIRSGFEFAEDEMDLESMQTAIRQLNQVAIQLTECEEFAIHEFQLFGMVQSIATAIYESLTADETWALSQSGFTEDDARRSFQMVYTDGAGNTASVVVIPNREVLARRELGEIQFFVDVCDGMKTENRERCEIIRNGLLSRLESDGIEIGSHNKEPRHAISTDQASFMREATRQGDRIKEDRLAIVREQLQLTV